MIDENEILQPSNDTVDAVANAILDAMEQDNAEKGAFSGQMPREKYRPLMTRFARAAIAAYVTAQSTPSGPMPEHRHEQLTLIRKHLADGYEKVSGGNVAKGFTLALAHIHYLLSLPNAQPTPSDKENDG